jgi:hypothetical protein
MDTRPRQRLRIEDEAEPGPHILGSSHQSPAHSNNATNNSPGPPRCRSNAHARRDAAAFSYARRLERFRARRAAIMAADTEDEIGEEDDEEVQEEIPWGEPNNPPSREDITGPSKRLSQPVQKARKLLMVSTVCSKD